MGLRYYLVQRLTALNVWQEIVAIAAIGFLFFRRAILWNDGDTAGRVYPLSARQDGRPTANQSLELRLYLVPAAAEGNLGYLGRVPSNILGAPVFALLILAAYPAVAILC